MQASRSPDIDRFIRHVSAEAALQRTGELWQRWQEYASRGEDVPYDLYRDLLCYTARRVLIQLEENGFDDDTWRSYRDFFMMALMAYGTSDATVYLSTASQMLKAVLAFPSRPEPLLKAYRNSVAAQQSQRRRELAAYSSEHPSSPSPPLECLPDLEYDGMFVACVAPIPEREMVALLERLPRHITVAHRHGILPLRLCNPLPIPGCSGVLTGYRCDTCHQRGIGVGFQAAVFDEETDSENAAPFTPHHVRSNAQIGRRETYGFDVCLACATWLYQIHEEKLLTFLRQPHPGFAVGYVAGVAVLSAQYVLWRSVAASESMNNMVDLGASTPLGSESTLMPETECSGERSHSSADSNQGSNIEVGTAWEGSLRQQHPPSRLPRRRATEKATIAGRAVVPVPPATRCVAVPGAVVTLSIGLAPYGARPAVWILSEAEESLEATHLNPVLGHRLGPGSDWRSRVTIRRRASVAQQSLRVSASSSAMASPSSRSTPSPAVSSAGTSQSSSVSPLHHAVSSCSCFPLTISTPLNRVGADAIMDEDGCDVCAICLALFDVDAPTIKTRCHHWFHVCCIEQHSRTVGDVCPLCRTTPALPNLSRATALANNIFDLEVRLTEEERGRPYVDVCVAAVLTRDGNYRNTSSIAAARCVRLHP